MILEKTWSYVDNSLPVNLAQRRRIYVGVVMANRRNCVSLTCLPLCAVGLGQQERI